MTEPSRWLDGLATVDVDVTCSGRRVVRGRSADGTGIARIGDAHAGVGHEVVAWEDADRAPAVDLASRLAATMLPLACALVPGLAAASDTDLVRQYVERFKNEKQLAVFPRAFARVFRHEFAYEADSGGWLSWIATGRTFLAGFPDVSVTIVDLFEADGLVVEHNLARGTHLGVFRGIAPTGRVVTWREVHIYRCARGRIVRNWPTVDVRELLRQLKE